MNKKILGICMALVAFGALAIGPTSASAFNLHLTDTNAEGKTVPLAVGAKILAIGETNENSTFTAGESTVSCNENTLTGPVHSNTTVGGNVRGEITFASFDSHLNPEGTECRSSGGFSGTGPVLVTVSGLPWCIQALAEDKWTLSGGKCTEEPRKVLTFALNFTNIGLTCKYQRTAGVSGTFSTTGATHEAATLSVTGTPEFVEDEPKFLCPDTGKITNMKFRLYTDTVATQTTYDDPASTADPVWLAE
jgi:hypothetical protein